MNRDDYEEFSIKGKRANMKIHYIIKKRGRRQTGHGEPRRETSRTQGDEKKEQGIQQAAIKSRRRERKKDSEVDEAGLTQNRKRKEFFEVPCSNLLISNLWFSSLSNTCHNSSIQKSLPFFHGSSSAGLPKHRPTFPFFIWNIRCCLNIFV